MSLNFSFLNLPLDGIPEEIKLPAIAIYLADILNKQDLFWGIVLSYPTPDSFNQAGGLAVRQFVEIILTRLGPSEILKRVQPVLLDPSTNWDSLGLKSLTEDFVGAPLTMQNKMDLAEILIQSSHVFLNGMIRELMFVLGNVDYGYGYGYSFDDLLMQDYSFGYGVGYNKLDYFNVMMGV